MSTEIIDTTEGEAERVEDFRDDDIVETQVSQEINITGLDYFFCFFLRYIVYIVYVVLRCKHLGQNFKCVELVTFGMYLLAL